MPIYAYRCGACGHARDVLQKLSDPILTTCLACGAEAFTKQLTSAGFQLKGSGWYVTDFRDGGKTADKAKVSDESAAGKATDGKTASAASDGEKGKASTAAEASAAGAKADPQRASASAAAPAPSAAAATPSPAKPASPPPASGTPTSGR